MIRLSQLPEFLDKVVHIRRIVGPRRERGLDERRCKRFRCVVLVRCRMPEAQVEELGAEALRSRQTNVELVERWTHLVDFFLFAFNLLPSCFERLCLVERILGLRP